MLGFRPAQPWWLLFFGLRAPHLATSIVPVILGAAAAFCWAGRWSWPAFLYTLAGMVSIHIGVNTVKESLAHWYIDDMQFGLPSQMETLCAGLACVALGSLIGVYLVIKSGALLLFIGLTGLAGASCYVIPTHRSIARTIGQPLAAIGCGLLPAIGAYYVQTAAYSSDVVLLALPAAFLVFAMTIIDQLQDHGGNGYPRARFSLQTGLVRAERLTSIVHLLTGMALALGVLAAH